MIAPHGPFKVKCKDDWFQMAERTFEFEHGDIINSIHELLRDERQLINAK